MRKKVSDICIIKGGYTPKNDELCNKGSIPYFKVSDMNREGNQKYMVNTDLYLKGTTKTFPAGSIVFPKNGGAVLTNKKRILITDSVVDLNTGIALLKDGVDSNYLYYFFLSLDFKNFLKEGTLPVLRTNEISNLPLYVPSLSEQERIVKQLDEAFAKIDALKENAQKGLQAMKDLWQATLRNVFIPKECWQTKTFGEVGTLERGGNFLKSDFVDNGFPCIHYGQIHMKFGTFTYNHITCIPESLAKKKAHKGDIIIAITSENVACSCKSTAWLGDYDVAIGAHAAIYRHTLNPKFVSYFIQAPYFQKEKEKYTHGFKVVEIKPSDIAKISISYPSENEQNQIVEKLDRIYERCQNYKIKYDLEIAEYEALKQSILRKAFSGEL